MGWSPCSRPAAGNEPRTGQGSWWVLADVQPVDGHAAGVDAGLLQQVPVGQQPLGHVLLGFDPILIPRWRGVSCPWASSCSAGDEQRLEADWLTATVAALVA